MRPNATYVRPGELAAEVIERVIAFSDENRAKLADAASVVQEILDAAFFTSLLAEEGQRVAVSLAYLLPPLGHWAELRPLVQPVAVTPSSLRKIAAGLDPWRTKLAVRQGDDNTLEAWALVNDDRRADTLSQEMRFRVYPGGGEILVTAFAPGSVDVSWCGRPVLALRAGQRIPLTETESADTALVVGAATAKRCPADNHVVAHWQSSALLHVLQCLATQKHGGTLLVTGTGPMLSHNDSYVFVAPDTVLRAAVDACVASNSQPVESRERLLANRALRAAGEYVAQLAAVDGAIVLSPSLAIVSFGSMIASPVDGPIRVLQRSAFEHGAPEREVPFKTCGGARHQSAAAWCASNVSEDFALVCSHDGGIAVVANGGAGTARLLKHLYLSGQ